MSLTFTVHQSMDQVAKELKFPVLSHCKSADVNEKSKLPDISNYYLVIYDNQQQVGLMYFQLLSVKPYHFNISDKKIQQFSLSWALRIVKPTLLITGNLFRHDMLFHEFFEPEITATRKGLLYQAGVEHMIKHTNASGIYLKDVEKDIAVEVAKDDSYTPMPDDISMEMHIPEAWCQLTDYQSALKHKYVQRFKKITGTFNQVSIQALELNDVEQYQEEIHALYMQVVRRQMVSMGILNPSFFVELKRSLGDTYKMYGFFYEGRMVAFSSAIMHAKEYDMNYIGFDYAMNHTLNLYFNILFHCVDKAIEFKAEKLILGRTAIEAKAIMGCMPDYRFSYYKLRNVVVNWFYQMVAKYFREQQGEAWKDRHPFKSNYYQNN